MVRGLTFRGFLLLPLRQTARDAFCAAGVLAGRVRVVHAFLFKLKGTCVNK